MAKYQNESYVNSRRRYLLERVLILMELIARDPNQTGLGVNSKEEGESLRVCYIITGPIHR